MEKESLRNRPGIAIEFRPERNRLFMRRGRIVTLNLAEALNQPAPFDGLIAKHAKLKSMEVSLISSHVRLMRSIRYFLSQGGRLPYSKWLAIRQCCACLTAGLWNLTKIDWEPSDSPVYGSHHPNAARYGNVELRVVENFLYQDAELLANATAIAKEIAAGTFLQQPQKQDSAKWLSAGDFRFNIQALMSNAGFYFPREPLLAADAIKEWCKLYFDELLSSSIFDYPAAYPFYFPTLQAIFEKSPAAAGREPLGFPSPFDFYEVIKGKRILIVTPFAQTINELYESGNIFNLYKNRVLPTFSLKAIGAPMSIFPRRPHGSWRESFDQTCDAIAGEIKESRYDIFTASAGCYGIPLCGYVRKEHKLSTLYYGNHINTLFGILQQCSKDFMSESRNNVVWRNGNLAESFPEISTIDAGRYI